MRNPGDKYDEPIRVRVIAGSEIDPYTGAPYARLAVPERPFIRPPVAPPPDPPPPAPLPIARLRRPPWWRRAIAWFTSPG